MPPRTWLAVRVGSLGLILSSALFQEAGHTIAQTNSEPVTAAPGPMLSQGVIDLTTPDFALNLVRSSQTVAALEPKAAGGFDFTPGDLLAQRSRDGYYHLGDLDLRLRSFGSEAWKNYSTALARSPVTALPSSPGILAAADLAPTLPPDIPLQVKRTWALENGKLVLRFTLRNKSAEKVEIGGLGIPMIFNNVLTKRSLDEAHAKCSFYDPYIGEDAGYLQVTRLSGHGPALLVVPDGKTPFEAYKPILDSKSNTPPAVFEDPTPRSITFEGFYDWMVHSRAFAENEWKNARQWNPPSSLTLAPGEEKTYGVRFLLAPAIREIEKTLAANHRPVAVGIPGYVLPTDTEARLLLKYARDVQSIASEPQAALAIRPLPATRGGWQAYAVQGKTWGRARMTIVYEDGLTQTIHYFVMKPAAQTVADMGHFLITRQWYGDAQDPFHRSPSVMTYDGDAHAIVIEDSRVWIAGLGDEGGGGAWLAAIMKQLVQPNRQELDRYAQFVDGTLWGGLQHKEGPQQYAVRKSLFYYEPAAMPPGYYQPEFDWSTWTSWNKHDSERVDRSFDYPHVVAAYWVLYRLARNYQGLVSSHSWQWYLSHAFETSMAMTKFAPQYAVYGQMEGDIFLQVLVDLKREGMNDQAAALEANMRTRTDRWKKEAYPYGSEMPWDSTGQEEVYAWTKYFGYEDKAAVTLNAILGYDPTIPHWGYNGSARRYWDFLFAGSYKYRRLERQLHHYGSGLNAIPLLAEYREHPDDLYLLRVGYGGTMGVLTDIDQEGFASAAFHAFPDMLRPDPISGDYGTNFFGHAWNTATYVVDDPEFGWLAFGGNLRTEKNSIVITPLDSYRARLYVAPKGLWLTLDAGRFESVEVTADGAIRLGLAAATTFTPVARLRIEQPANVNAVGRYHPRQALPLERDAYVVTLAETTTWVELLDKP
jgi:hypothetical protein